MAANTPVARFQVKIQGCPEGPVVCEYEAEDGIYAFVRRSYNAQGKLLNENYKFGRDCETPEEASAEFEGFVAQAIGALVKAGAVARRVD